MATRTQKNVSFPTVVNLNVGGQIYITSLSTLTKYSESMLGAMFSGRFAVQQDSNGNYFIDRDGALFRHVLAFLRNGELHVPENFNEFGLLLKEAEFYQIPALIQTVKQQTKNAFKHKAPTQDETEAITMFADQHSNGLFTLNSVSGRLCTLTEMFHIANKDLNRPFEVDPYSNQSGLNYDTQTVVLTRKYNRAVSPDAVLTVAQSLGFRIITDPCVNFPNIPFLGNAHWVLTRP